MECPMCDGEDFIVTDELDGYTFYECIDCHCTWSTYDNDVEEIWYEGY